MMRSLRNKKRWINICWNDLKTLYFSPDKVNKIKFKSNWHTILLVVLGVIFFGLSLELYGIDDAPIYNFSLENLLDVFAQGIIFLILTFLLIILIYKGIAVFIDIDLKFEELAYFSALLIPLFVFGELFYTIIDIILGDINFGVYSGYLGNLVAEISFFYTIFLLILIIQHLFKRKIFESVLITSIPLIISDIIITFLI